jgi:signal transduction histidine kinase
VRVRSTEDAVVLEVADGGPARSGTAERLSTGHGLVGMRERVALFGGSLEAGPHGGGWRVRAELPFSPASVVVRG